MSSLVVTDLRLAELIRKLGETSFFYSQDCEQMRGALQELQDSRQVLYQLAECDGAAREHLKGHGQPVPVRVRPGGLNCGVNLRTGKGECCCGRCKP